MDDPGRFLTIEDVTARTTLSRSEVYRRVGDKRFPSPLSLSKGRVAWVEREVIAWQIEQIERARA